MLHRRSFLLGLGAAVAAPAIIRPGILMPVKQMLFDNVALSSVPAFGDGPEHLYIFDGAGAGQWVLARDVERLSIAKLSVNTVIYGVVAATGNGFYLGDVVVRRDERVAS